ncbi:MAG: hypothetical protein WBG85_04785 [Rhodanobacter sp.]
MDTFSRRRLGVLFGAAALVVLLLVPVVLRAAAQYPTSAEAMAVCAADPFVVSQPDRWRCSDYPAMLRVVKETFNPNFSRWDSVATYTYDGVSNPCDGMDSASIYLEGKVLQGSRTCVRGPVQPNGSQAMCGVTLTPISPPTYNPWAGGHWQTYVSFQPTGQACSDGSGDDAGLILGPDGTLGDAPPVPDPTPPDNPSPPKVCGGVSCYDPATDTACGMVDGVQACVSGASGRSTTGGCASSGGTTICNGSPNPPPPPAGDVPNPPGQVGGSDTGAQADPVTGVTIPVGVTIYGPPGGTVTTGQGPNDSGPPAQSGGGTGGDDGTGGDPAGSSSTGGDNGSFSGGADCNNPPACSGDAVACGAARTQWATTCQVHKDLAGTSDGQAALDALKGKYTQADVWSETGGSGSTVGDQANAGTYDSSGFGFATQCPMTNLSVPLWEGRSIDLPLEKGCIIGPWIRGIVLAFALYAAARITAGSDS